MTGTCHRKEINAKLSHRMPPVVSGLRRTAHGTKTRMEMYDIDDGILPENRNLDNVHHDDDKPVAYCFEDFVPEDPVFAKPAEVRAPQYDIGSYSSLKRSRRPELKRSITLPIYRNHVDLSASNGTKGKSWHEDSHKDESEYPGSAWSSEDDRESTTTTTSDTVTSVSEKSSSTSSGVVRQMYYTTPPTANMSWSADEKRLEEPRYAPLGMSKSCSQNCINNGKFPPEKQRSASEDWGDIHSIHWSESNGRGPPRKQSEGSPLLKRNIQANHSSYRLSKVLAASQSKRGSIGSSSSSSPEFLPTKRKTEKENKRLSTNTKALFEAVEQQDIDLVKTILEQEATDINCINNEGLSPLDVAVLTNNIPMAKILLYHGAKESPLFLKEDARSSRLDFLVSDAEKKVVDLSAAILNAAAGNGAISSTQQKENERQLSHWELRHKLLKRMRAGYDHARSPDPPSYVSLTVASSSSLVVKFDEPLNHNGAVVTKYKVQWSCFEDFLPVLGEVEIDDMRNLEYEIKGLTKGNKYYIRVAASNLKGYSGFTLSKPGYAAPSSWRDVEDTSTCRTDGKLQIFEDLFCKVRKLRSTDSSDLKDSIKSDSPQKKHKSLKNLFTSAPKFVKTLKRGVYLACLLHHGDRVFVTSDDQLPIVEVDENFTGASITAELHWLMKVSCAWDSVKSLRQAMERNTSPSMQLRHRFLQALSVLQSALGVQDLGLFYHKPLKDSSSCIVLTTVCNVKDPKTVQLSSGKWSSIVKYLRRSSACLLEQTQPLDALVGSLPEMILYSQVSTTPLKKGLYLGYLKLQASLEVNCVLVPRKSPNSLPHVRVRDCPNISREEWEWLQSLTSDNHKVTPNSTQQEFGRQLSMAAKNLFKMLDISEDLSSDHRMYNIEVVDFSEDVSFILVLPPAEDVCLVPGQGEKMAQLGDLTFLPVQVFEMILMGTYQSQLINKYARTSCILEIDLSLAQQSHREAFSPAELSSSRALVDKLAEIQQELEKSWKSMRWIMDIISYARDRSAQGAITIDMLISPHLSLHKSCLPENSELGGSLSEQKQRFCSQENITDSNEISVGKDQRKIAKFYDPTEEETESGEQTQTKDDNSNLCNNNNSFGILQVYAAYESGLSKGTRVRLHVTAKTTARDIINLVVKQLNKAISSKGRSSPIYQEERLCDFCLVAVIGARERILRDDFKPLQLQNPWTEGKLYVRLKNNILAAIQHGRATEV